MASFSKKKKSVAVLVNKLMLVDSILSFSLKYFYKNNDKWQLDNENCIKLKNVIQTQQNKIVIFTYIDNKIK